jgi:glycosyltransferase involved in cell wall biosynthesis
VENLTIVPVSYWLADLVNESFLQKYPIQVIHNGINSGVFKPTNTHKIKEKYNLFDKFILLGVASIWDKRKGLEDFIKLSGLLKKDEALILVGLTDKQIKLLPKNIIGIKRTEDINELAELYSCSDIFVNPTWEDNFPTTNLEALACGTPVVTYKTGGSPEAISLEAGFVVEQGDITALRKVIDKVKYNGKNLYQEACRNRALLFFKKEDRFDEYIRLYKKLINKSWK